MPTADHGIVRIFVVGEPDFRCEVERLLQTERDSFRFVGSAEALAEAQPLLRRLSADVILVDLDGVDVGAAGQSVLRSEIAVLAVSSQDPCTLQWALMSGLRGVVRIGQSQTIVKAIHKVLDGEIWIDRSLASFLITDLTRRRAILVDNEVDRQRIAALTPRERETIVALTSDVAVPAKVIAARLRISENTLRNHLTSVYAKLELQNRLDLYAYAMRHQIDVGSKGQCGRRRPELRRNPAIRDAHVA